MSLWISGSEHFFMEAGMCDALKEMPLLMQDYSARRGDRYDPCP